MKIQESSVDLTNLQKLRNARALVVESDYNACSSATQLLWHLGMRAEWTMYGNEAVLLMHESAKRGEYIVRFTSGHHALAERHSTI